MNLSAKRYERAGNQAAALRRHDGFIVISKRARNEMLDELSLMLAGLEDAAMGAAEILEILHRRARN